MSCKHKNIKKVSWTCIDCGMVVNIFEQGVIQGIKIIPYPHEDIKEREKLLEKLVKDALKDE